MENEHLLPQLLQHANRISPHYPPNMPTNRRSSTPGFQPRLARGEQFLLHPEQLLLRQARTGLLGGLLLLLALCAEGGVECLSVRSAEG